MTIDSTIFEALPGDVQAQWIELFRASADQLDEHLQVLRVVNNTDDSGVCVIMEGPDLGELRPGVSTEALREARHDEYMRSLGIELTEARLATGF